MNSESFDYNYFQAFAAESFLLGLTKQQERLRESKRLPDPFNTYSQQSGPHLQHLLEATAMSRDTAIIQVIGVAGHGKSSLVARLIHMIEGLNGRNEKCGCVTFESSQQLGKELLRPDGIPYIDPTHVSGYYTVEDYQVATEIFTLLHTIALKKHRIVIAETVSLNGILDTNGNPIGMPRGTESIYKVCEKYNDKTIVIGVVSDEEQFASALQDRWQQSASLTGRPGGSGLGTELIAEDIEQLMKQLFPTLSWQTILDNPDTHSVLLATVFVPSIIRKFFNRNDKHGIVLFNHYKKEELRGQRALIHAAEKDVFQRRYILDALTKEDRQWINTQLTKKMRLHRRK